MIFVLAFLVSPLDAYCNRILSPCLDTTLESRRTLSPSCRSGTLGPQTSTNTRTTGSLFRLVQIIYCPGGAGLLALFSFLGVASISSFWCRIVVDHEDRTRMRTTNTS